MSQLILSQQSTAPSAPSTGKVTVYVDGNGDLSLKDASGNITKIAAAGSYTLTLNSSGTLALGGFTFTLTSNSTLALNGNTLTVTGGSPTITGAGTLATGGYTLTVPATGTAALIANSTWTPSLLFGGANTGMTYAARYGAYFTIGGLLIAFAQIELSAKGSSTGAATISGLPVAAINTTNFYVPVYLQAYNVTGGFIEGNIAPGGTTINLYSLSAGTRSGLTHAEFVNNSTFQVVAIYQTV